MTTHEEVLMLRELLAKKDKIIEQQNIRIENMIQALLHARKKLFGVSSEVTKQIEGQMNLFETNEALTYVTNQRSLWIP